MTPDEIIEGNKLIAEFMGLNFSDVFDTCRNNLYDGTGHRNPEYLDNPINHICYHNSWDYLMPVYEKISYNLDFGWRISSTEIRIYSHCGQPQGDYDGRWFVDDLHNIIYDAHRSIVTFITWYNKQEKSNEEN